MADSKKYYYLKLKDNFYDSEEMIILQNMQDGYLYSDILLKLYLRSLKTEGKLMLKDVIPYTAEVLAQVVRHQAGTVQKAIDIFQKLGLIEILDNGAIYLTDIQNFIGQSSSEADRIRKYRNKINDEQRLISSDCTNVQENGVQMYDKRTPEIEIEIEIDKEIDKEIDVDGRECGTPPPPPAPAKKQNIYSYLEDAIGTLNPRWVEKLDMYLETMDEPCVRHAIDQATDNNKRFWSYIEKILGYYQSDGVHVLADAIAREDNFKNRNNAPVQKQSAPQNTVHGNYGEMDYDKYYTNFN